jgi:hypothetical protein
MNQNRPIGFEDEQADSFRQEGGQPPGVADLAAGDDQAHGRRTVLSVSDRHHEARVAIKTKMRYAARVARLMLADWPDAMRF